ISGALRGRRPSAGAWGHPPGSFSNAPAGRKETLPQPCGSLQGCGKIGNKRGSKGPPPLCGGLGASPSLFFSRARRAQRNFATALAPCELTVDTISTHCYPKRVGEMQTTELHF